MEFTEYLRVPFVVEAVMVTMDNIEELAPQLGDLRYNEDKVPYILADNRLVPNVRRIFLGFYITKMDGKLRAYGKKLFREQFVQHNDALRGWMDYIEKMQAES